MTLFEILKATDAVEQRVVKTIRFNARVIQRVEGRSRAEAMCLSIRTLLDSFRQQEHGEDGCKIVMKIVEKRYPQHLQNATRYVAWLSSHDHGDQENGTLSGIAARRDF